MLINSSTTQQFDSSVLNNGKLSDELNENPLFDALKLVMTMRDSLDPSRISEATQESSRMAQIAAGHLGL